VLVISLAVMVLMERKRLKPEMIIRKAVKKNFLEGMRRVERRLR